MICHPGETDYYGAKDDPIGYYCRKCDKLVVFEGKEVPLSYKYDLEIFREDGWGDNE